MAQVYTILMNNGEVIRCEGKDEFEAVVRDNTIYPGDGKFFLTELDHVREIDLDDYMCRQLELAVE